jgi:hypothetical protein
VRQLAQAKLTTLFVIASTEGLPWIEDLTRADCSSLVDKMPPDPHHRLSSHAGASYTALAWQFKPRSEIRAGRYWLSAHRRGQ